LNDNIRAEFEDTQKSVLNYNNYNYSMKDRFPEIIKKYDRACLFIVEMIIVCTKSIDYPSPFLTERRSFTVILRH